jgi:hypothetical protein
MAKKKAGLSKMILIVAKRKGKDPNSYCDSDGKSIVDENWLDGKSASVAKDLTDKKVKPAQFISDIDKDYPSDEKLMREEYKNARSAAK